LNALQVGGKLSGIAGGADTVLDSIRLEGFFLFRTDTTGDYRPDAVGTLF
jgi:hypothetical protein